MEINIGERPPKKPINADQVAWVMRALTVLLGAAVSPTATRHRTDAVKSSCLLEIMDALDLRFEDQAAAFNGLQLQEFRDALAPYELRKLEGGTVTGVAQ